MYDPIMPKRPPIAALKAIAQYKSYRVWEAIDVYHAIWEALQKPHGYPPERRNFGDGRPPSQ
jgi:hypothetical protein